MSKNYVDIAEISLTWNSSFLIDPDDETFELNMRLRKMDCIQDLRWSNSIQKS